jgi:rare lipoprotein A (peptidoglycan hydrolase)
MFIRGTKYVVQDQVAANFQQARKRIEQLKNYGLIANAISLTCTESTTKGYCVYYELMFNDQKSANGKAIDIKKDLDDLQLSHNNIQIRILKF